MTKIFSRAHQNLCKFLLVQRLNFAQPRNAFSKKKKIILIKMALGLLLGSGNHYDTYLVSG